MIDAMSVNNIAGESDSFWDIDGYQRAVKRAENGAHMCSELTKLINERAEIEREYAKRLKSWSNKWKENFDRGPEYASNKLAVCATFVEAEQLADLHLVMKDRLMCEVVPKIKEWKTENYKKQIVGGCKEAKLFEDEFRKVQKPWAKRLLKVMKAKKDYHNACKLERSAVNQENNAKNSSDTLPEQVKKCQEKVAKCRKEVESTRVVYRASLAELNAYNAKYMEEMNEVFTRTQEFEARRLTFIKRLLYDVHLCLDLTQNKQLPDIYSDFRHQIDDSQPEKDLQWWSENYGAAMSMAWPEFEEYSGEFHAITRKDRDSQLSQVSGMGDGITLRSIQRNDDTARPSSVKSLTSDPLPAVSNPSALSNTHCNAQNPFGDEEWDEYDHISTSTVNKSEVQVRALYDYQAQEDDELSFRAGELFTKLRDRDEQGWCTGKINGKIGLYPDNYVELLLH